MPINGLSYVENIIKKCDSLLVTLEQMGKAPNQQKVLTRKFSVNEAAALVSRTRASLNRVEKEGIASPEKDPKSKRILGYSLKEINQLRKHFGTQKFRQKGDPCLVIAVQSFKGGVAKSVTSIHLSQYLAMSGYRVLAVDCDPQASLTSSFGFLPDKVFDESHTMLPFLASEQESLEYCIIESYFPNLSLIPSCLPFYDAEFKLAFAASDADTIEERKAYYTEFLDAFNTIKDSFDFIVIDSPPALGMITINILTAADAIIVPTPPALYDFASTVQYFKMVRKIMKSVIPGKIYHFIKILATKVDTRANISVDILSLMREVFGGNMFQSLFMETSEIKTASADFKTVFDLQKPNQRAIKILKSVCEEIEIELLKAWPSKKKQLVEEGVI